MSDEHDDPMSAEWSGQPRWSNALGWLPVLALAALMYELTANPALGVAVGCVKFGADDFRIAAWLRRVDPNRGRGRACSWFFVTRAIIRIGFVASAIIMTLFFVSWAVDVKDHVEHQLIGALLVIIACFLAAGLASWMALASALRLGVRVWMDATARAAHKVGAWPPFHPFRSRRADLGPGLVVACGMLACGIISSIVFDVAVLIGLAGLGVLDQGFTIAAWLGNFCLVVAAFRLAPVILRRVVASSPWECYSDSLGEIVARGYGSSAESPITPP
jgi:hypothetical protein